MAITFPASPADGAVYTNPTTGVKYIYNATDDVWRTHIWPTNTDYLQLSGGTLTGNLSLGTNDLTAQDINSTTLTTTAGVTVGNGLTVSDGNVVMASGHGIDFSDTANSSGTMSSELLDDYEEGNWTPTYVPQNNSFTSITYDGVVYGYYQKVGATVYIHGFIRTDALTKGTASGTVYIGGLPFATQWSAGQNQGFHIPNSANFLGEDPTALMTSSNSNQLTLYYKTGATSNSQVTQVTDLNTSSNDNQVYFWGIFVAA